MLKSLSVRNFALIEKADLEFGEGLNILTGETGAGKSILIGALGAVLGHRVALSQIRAGCDELRVEAVFAPEKNSPVHEILSELEIDDADDTVIISRKVCVAGGKSGAIVNGSHVTLTTLKKIGAALVDIHGQNENLALLREESVYKLIDGADEKIFGVREDYKKLLGSLNFQIRALKEKKSRQEDNERRLEMLRHEEKEISDAQLKPREDEELEIEIRKLSHAEKISESVEEACLLLGGGSDFDVLTLLAKVSKNLAEISRFDDKLSSAEKLLEDATISLRDVYEDVRAYSETTEFSPEVLDKLHARTDVIYRLKRLYGNSVEEILEHLQKVREEISALENFDSDIETGTRLVAKLEKQTKAKSELLLNLRQKSAEKLGLAVRKELHRLVSEKAKFSISVEPVPELTGNGADKADMIFSANVGEEEKSLSKIVSGGELSRIALAIKTVSAGREDSAETMVFDEIDTGLGGKTAKIVGECIAKVAANKQVLCVTHLAQIACMADVHLQISKYDEDGRTKTRVKVLEKDSRVEEISRMASGEENPESMKNARAMIASANKLKREVKSRK